MGRREGERVENTSGWAARYGDLAITPTLGVNPREADPLANRAPFISLAVAYVLCS